MKRDGEVGMAVLACSCVASVASEHMHMALRRSSGVGWGSGRGGAFQRGRCFGVLKGVQ